MAKILTDDQKRVVVQATAHTFTQILANIPKPEYYDEDSVMMAYGRFVYDTIEDNGWLGVAEEEDKKNE